MKRAILIISIVLAACTDSNISPAFDVTKLPTGGNAYLPIRWARDNVQAGQTSNPVDIAGSRFNTFRVVRDGSVTGLVSRFSETVAIGIISLRVTIDGTQSDLGAAYTTGSDGGESTSPVGIIPYRAGDVIGLELATDGFFTPLTLDLEAAVSVFEGS